MDDCHIKLMKKFGHNVDKEEDGISEDEYEEEYFEED